jgi:hypothetical protein
LIRRALKWVAWTVLGLVVFILAWLLFALVINRFDEAPAPELALWERELAKPDLDPGNAFVLAMGLDAPAGADAWTAGQALILARFRRPDAVPPATSTWSTLACNPARQPPISCVAWYEERRGAIEEYLRSTAYVDDRYLQTMAKPGFYEWMPLGDINGIPRYSPLAEGAQRHDARIALDLRTASPESLSRRAAEHLAFQRRVLAGSGSMIGKMIAVSIHRRTLSLVSDLAAAKPALASALLREPGLLQELGESERSMLRPLKAEIFFAATALREDMNRESASDADDSSVLQQLARRASLLFLRPNETINTALRRNLALATWCQTAPSNLSRTPLPPSLAEPSASDLWAVLWPANPSGRVIEMIAAPMFPGYCRRVHDVEGHRRLVVLQLVAISQGVPAMEAALNKPEFMNPVRGEPMAWDPKLRRLRFEPTGASPSVIEAAVPAL